MFIFIVYKYISEDVFDESYYVFPLRNWRRNFSRRLLTATWRRFSLKRMNRLKIWERDYKGTVSLCILWPSLKCEKLTLVSNKCIYEFVVLYSLLRYESDGWMFNRQGHTWKGQQRLSLLDLMHQLHLVVRFSGLQWIGNIIWTWHYNYLLIT